VTTPGRIVNISSINGQKAQLGQTNYAKAGILGVSESLALETAPDFGARREIRK